MLGDRTCWFTTPRRNQKLDLIYGEWEETEERGYSRSVGGRANKQGDLEMRLALGSCKMSRYPHLTTTTLTTTTLTVYVEALKRLSPVYSPEILNDTLCSKVCVLEMILAMEMVGEHTVARTGAGVRSL